MPSADINLDRRLQALHTKVENTDKNVADAVVTAVGGTGGSANGTISVQLYDQYGHKLAKAAVIALAFGGTEYLGELVPKTTLAIATPTAGSSIKDGASVGVWIVKTDATGLFTATLTNSADETVYINAKTAPGGVDGVAYGITIRSCVPDDAVWSA
jgi:hypothetical protein